MTLPKSYILGMLKDQPLTACIHASGKMNFSNCFSIPLRKSSKVNWTIDAWNLWGVILTCNGYWTGGGHVSLGVLEFKPAATGIPA